jgi:hypothetical protein
LTPLKLAGTLLAISLASRLGAEFYPAQLMPLLLAASVAWVAAGLLWLGYVFWKTAGLARP